MRILTGLIVIILLAPFIARAQADDDWPPLSYLRKDYKDVAAVAHVNVSKAEVVSKIVGKENWKVTGKVIEPLKGRLKKGADLEYYHGAEAGFKREWFLGEKIVFLLHDYDRQRAARVYTVLENSTLKYTPEIVKKLRAIKRSLKHRPKSRRAIRKQWATQLIPASPLSPVR